jgi:hypothetical protein
MSQLPTWREMQRDTADWADDVQFAWRRAAPAWRKLQTVNQLNRSVLSLAYSGVRQRHPQASPVELRRLLTERTLGSHLTQLAFDPSQPLDCLMTQTSGIAVTLQVIDALNTLGVDYLLGGSLASALYGMERSTLDADLVVDLRLEHVALLVEQLNTDFYIDPASILEAILNRSSFNVIHQGTMFKVDVFVPKARPFDRTQLGRRVEQVVAFDPERTAYVATAEDIILAKLEWFRLGGGVSERQWRDVLGVIKTQSDRLDLDYLRHWAAALNVADLLELALTASDA